MAITDILGLRFLVNAASRVGLPHLVLKIIVLRIELVLNARHFDLELADVVLDAFVLDGGAGVGDVSALADGPLARRHVQLAVVQADLVAGSPLADGRAAHFVSRVRDLIVVRGPIVLLPIPIQVRHIRRANQSLLFVILLFQFFRDEVVASSLAVLACQRVRRLAVLRLLLSGVALLGLVRQFLVCGGDLDVFGLRFPRLRLL